MDITQFDFDLPEDRIALRPAEPRESARLLLVRAETALEDRRVADLPDLLEPGDLLVLNDTRVIPARLSGIRRREGGGEGARVEALLIARDAPDRWRALARPAKRLAPGDAIRFGPGTASGEGLEASVVEKGEGGEILLAFHLGGPALDEAVATVGQMPLPPYIAGRREPDERDRADYQTVYARREGAVAAPTAGFHLTDGLLRGLAERGIETCLVTLHVGTGTFLPVKVGDVREHRMHAEEGEISPEAAEKIEAARRAGRRIVAVGTTALRLLESAVGEDGRVRPFKGWTSIFMVPGHRFRTADALLTNFHLPRSTLFMLVCAYAGTEAMRRAYAHAVEHGYRFYSYGDASLLFRADQAEVRS